MENSLSQNGNGNYPWFALHVRSHFEDRVAAILGTKGYERFFPQYKSRRVWSDRLRDTLLPLFPGYVFCRIDLHHRLPILKTPGVLGIVGVGRIPFPIDDGEITSIQAAVRSGLPCRPWPFLRIGQKVSVESGPLCGLEGIVLYFKGQRRLVLSVTLLQRSLAVEVDGTWVIPIPHAEKKVRFSTTL